MPRGAELGYEVLEVAGRGASADVYRARAHDGRFVALKVATSHQGWLQREGALLGNLARRWGPSLVDAGWVPAGTPGLVAGAPFIASTWVEGRSLSTLLDDPSVDRTRLALRVAHDVGRALDELHGMGVVHGDVKLGNILAEESRRACWTVGLQPGGGLESASDRAVTLIDMGLASTVEDGAFMGGTVRYLAPEVRSGLPPAPSADLYALGLVLAEILRPELASSASPRAELPTWSDQDGEVGGWIEALVAENPGARPGAGWLADRAAAALGIAPTDEERLAARRSRVRRTYLAVRGPEIASARAIAEGIEGPCRTWLVEAMHVQALTGEAGAEGSLEPLDAIGMARWLVRLVGPAAAAWTLPDVPEGAFAARLLELCERSAPDAWTLEDTLGEDGAEPVPSSRSLDAPFGSGPRETVWLSLTRMLLAPSPSSAVLALAEEEVARGAPLSLAMDLASALLRRGDVGRAYLALTSRRSESPEAALLVAEIERRRGHVVAASSIARAALELGSERVRGDARALLARLAWDRGAHAEAEALVAPARGAAAAEVKGLLAYVRGDFEGGVQALDVAARQVTDPLGVARLHATRGMLEHARGRAEASFLAFSTAAELATRQGAIVEEATYLTGLAAAAVDAGAVERALSSSTRAALLWERLSRPTQAARALLSRASAFALVGASHEADASAQLAIRRARDGGDRRAQAFARWATVETRPAGDRRAREEAQAADDELRADASPFERTGEDGVRSAARLLVWADGVLTEDDVRAIDRSVHARTPSAQWEWWGARAFGVRREGAGALQRDGARVVAALVSLQSLPAPIGSRGVALAEGAHLAAELGDGDAMRRFESARRTAADALLRGTPAAHRGALARVGWTEATEAARKIGAPALGAEQVAQLDAIVRALSSRDRLKPLLEQVLDTMVLWTGVERGLLLLKAPDGNLVPRVARNLARRDLEGEQLTLSMGIAKRAMEERDAVIATDAFAQVGELHASVHALRLRSVLAVPLIARGDTLGVVYLDDRVRRGAFGPAELAWVRLVASQAALAIADARDQALLRRAVRRAERANAELSRELGAREAELSAVRAELTQGAESRYRYDEIAGRSEPVRVMLKLVDRVTSSDVPVLLVGESGTGKELVARAIHGNGARAARPFVSENCGAVPEALLESTLFGHLRGAFTGASSTRAGLFDVANGGTLLLDEIGEMPLTMQTKLLRVLQDGEIRPVGSERSRKVDVRIIGATHRDLGAMVAAGTFREDLYYRLNVVAVRIPALRERTADIPLLVAHLLEKHAKGRRMKVTRAAMDRLIAYPWPGNVRQLENELRRALVLADERIEEEHLSEEVTRGATNAAREAGFGLRARVDALEAELVRDALVRTKGNQTRAAEALGISRFGLQKMMRRLGIKGV